MEFNLDLCLHPDVNTDTDCVLIVHDVRSVLCPVDRFFSSIAYDLTLLKFQ